MAKHIYLRADLDGPSVSLSRNLFRKQLLRFGTWDHASAPDGKLEVTKAFVTKIIENFRNGVRDDVPIPLGHDKDAISSIGQVIGLEMDDEGLWGIHQITENEDAEKLGDTWTGSSAFIDLDATDKETGEHYGPVLVHNAITNAPFVKGLASFEALALGEDAEDAVIISLHETTVTERGFNMTLEEMLAQLAETSDDDLKEALTKTRPELFAALGEKSEDAPGTQAKLDDAKAEGRKEVVAALAEKGITVALAEGEGDPEKTETKVDITSAPEFVSLSERVDALALDKATTDATSVIDKAITEGKIVPSQKEGLLKVALSEGGMDTLKMLIPEKAVVDLSEHGVSTSEETNVQLSEEDASKEADRLVAAYSTTGTKEVTK